MNLLVQTYLLKSNWRKRSSTFSANLSCLTWPLSQFLFQLLGNSVPLAHLFSKCITSIVGTQYVMFMSVPCCNSLNVVLARSNKHVIKKAEVFALILVWPLGYQINE